MTGLILKDILVMRRTIRTYVLFLAFYSLLAVFDIFPLSTVTAVTELIIMMLPLSAFSYDEYAKWDRYAAALPLGRRAVVGARYCFALLMAAAATLFCLVLAVSRFQAIGNRSAAILGRRGNGTFSMVSSSNPACGTRSRSRPTAVPITAISAEGSLALMALATASSGLTCPAVPPPANTMRCIRLLIAYELSPRAGPGRAFGSGSCPQCPCPRVTP